MVNTQSPTMKHLVISVIVLISSFAVPCAHAARPVLIGSVVARPVVKRVIAPVRHVAPHTHRVLTPRAFGSTKPAPYSVRVYRKR